MCGTLCSPSVVSLLRKCLEKGKKANQRMLLSFTPQRHSSAKSTSRQAGADNPILNTLV